MSAPLPSTTRLASLALLAALVLGVSCAPGAASRAELARYRARRGRLVTSQSQVIGARGRYVLERLHLVSSTGLVATGRLLRPRGIAGPLPAVLLDDGRELGSRALDYLPADFGDVVVLSLDYPRAIPERIDLGTALRHIARLHAAAHRIPAEFSLGAMYLAARADVDSTRLAITATSFAVPFAVIAAAADTRFRNVALIYGAGDLPAVLAANLRVRPAWLRRPLAWLALRPFADLAPERFVARIARRPLVMVNGSDDPQMPVNAVRSLYDAARSPKRQVWLRTGHLEPDDSALIRALVDSALAGLPVLARTQNSNGCLVGLTGCKAR